MRTRADGDSGLYCASSRGRWLPATAVLDVAGIAGLIVVAVLRR